MATFRSGVKILGHISKTKGHGGTPFRSRSCDRRTLLNLQKRQESAFAAQDSCEESLKETRRSRSWLSIFSRNKSPDSAAEEERISKKEDDSWFSYFSRKPPQANEEKLTSKAVEKEEEEHIPKNNKEEKYVIRTVHSDITRDNISSSIAKSAVCHFHKGTNIMSPRSTVVQPLSREITIAYSRSGFHSIPSNSFTKDKVTASTKHVAVIQHTTDVNYSSMVTQNSHGSTSLPYTAADVQNLLMTSLSKSSYGCANPYSLNNNEVRRNSHKGISQEKTNITDFGSQNLQLHTSTSRGKSKTSDMKHKEIKQHIGLAQRKLQSKSSLPNDYADKVDHKALYSESSVASANERQKREREAFLKTKSIISKKPEASTQTSKVPSGKMVLRNNSSSSIDNSILKYKPLKLTIKPKGKSSDHITNPYTSESKPKTQKSKYISDSPLIKQKSHPTQFHVHPSMIANSSIPLRLSSSTASTSEKYEKSLEESRIYHNDIKGPITSFCGIINKLDDTAEQSYTTQSLRSKPVLLKKSSMDPVLQQENLTQQENYMAMNQATKTENANATKVSSDPQSNAEIQSLSLQETATEVNSKGILVHNHTKQNDYSKMVAADHSQKPTDIDSADRNTAEEIMLEKKHKYRDDLTENMKSKFGMHIPYFKSQNNISALKKGRNNKNDAAKPLLGKSPRLAKQKEVDETEVDKLLNNETSKASSPRTALEEHLQQKTEVLSEMSKSLDSKSVTASDDINIKSDKDIANECATSTSEMKKSETASEEVPELTLQAEGPSEDNVEAQLEKPTPSLRRHRYFPNYFSKRSLSGYVDPPGFGDKSEISFCPGKEKGSNSGNDKCKKIDGGGEKPGKSKPCVKVHEPGCKVPKSTLCKPPLPSDECHKRMPPAPSYSECMKAPIPPKPYTECDPIPDMECPGEKARKDYDACKQKFPEDVCAGSDKRKKLTEEEIMKTDNSCPEEAKCPEPYKGQKTMGKSGSPMKCLSRQFSTCQFQNYISKRFYSTSENGNPLLCNRNLAIAYPDPMISLSSFYHKKVECKANCDDIKPPDPCKKVGKKEDKKKKPVCVKIKQEGCVVPKSTLCVPPTNFEKCNKVLAPKPSFSECMRSVEIPPRRFTECDPTIDLECPVKQRKNYDACKPTKKPDNACPTKQEKKPIQWKDNTCVKEEECPTNGKKASTGISNAAVKCPSMNKTAAYLPPRRYFSCASGRYILKCHSSPALDSCGSHNEEMTHSPFIVAQYMRNNLQQPIHERSTQKGKPLVTLSASYSTSPIFLDYMALKNSCKCKNCITLYTNFLQKIDSHSLKVNKVAKSTNSERPSAKEAGKRIGTESKEMERLSVKDISKEYRLSKSYVSEAKCLTFGCLLHNKQDTVPERTYCTWSTTKQSTKITSQENNISSIRQCSSFKKRRGSSDSLNEPCPPPVKEHKKEENPCEKPRGEKPFGDCPPPKQESLGRCPTPKRMKVVSPPRQEKPVVTILDCPKPPKKVIRKCEEPPPPPPPPPPPKVFVGFAECPKPKPKVKRPCTEEVKEEVPPPPPVCRNTEPAPTFTQCPKPKPKARRTCDVLEPPSETCIRDGKKQRPECVNNSSKKKASGTSSQFILSPISQHSAGIPINLSGSKVRLYYKLARNYSREVDKTSAIIGRKSGMCFGGLSFWQEIAESKLKLPYEGQCSRNASSIQNIGNVYSKTNINMLHFLSNMKHLLSFLKVTERYPELYFKHFMSVKHTVPGSEKNKQTTHLCNQYKYINKPIKKHSIISTKRMSGKNSRHPPSFSEYMHLKSKSKRYNGKIKASPSKQKTKQYSLNCTNTSIIKKKKQRPCLKLPVSNSVMSFTPALSTNSSPDASNASASQLSLLLLPPPKSCTLSLSTLPETSSAMTVEEPQSTHSTSEAASESLSSPATSSCSSTPLTQSSYSETSSIQTTPLPQSVSPPSIYIEDQKSLIPLASLASKCLPKLASLPTQQLPASQLNPAETTSPPPQIFRPTHSCLSSQGSSLVKSASPCSPCSPPPSSKPKKCPPPPPPPKKCAPPIPPPKSKKCPPPPPPPPPVPITCSGSPKSLKPPSLAKKCSCLLPEIICKILKKENTLDVCRGKKKCSKEDF